jgi:hypothetical protein
MGAVPLYGRTAVGGITVHPDDGDPVVLAGEVRTPNMPVARWTGCCSR